MKITLERAGTIYTLHSYHHGEIVIRPPNAPLEEEDALMRLTGSCLLSAAHLVDDWPPKRLAELEEGHLQLVRDLQPEVLLIGSGTKLRMPTAEQRAALVRLGIGHEVMDTGAACRTYNVLVAEERRVVAALFAS